MSQIAPSVDPRQAREEVAEEEHSHWPQPQRQPVRIQRVPQCLQRRRPQERRVPAAEAARAPEPEPEQAGQVPHESQKMEMWKFLGSVRTEKSQAEGLMTGQPRRSHPIVVEEVGAPLGRRLAETEADGEHQARCRWRGPPAPDERTTERMERREAVRERMKQGQRQRWALSPLPAPTWRQSKRPSARESRPQPRATAARVPADRTRCPARQTRQFSFSFRHSPFLHLRSKVENIHGTPTNKGNPSES